MSEQHTTNAQQRLGADPAAPPPADGGAAAAYSSGWTRRSALTVAGLAVAGAGAACSSDDQPPPPPSSPAPTGSSDAAAAGQQLAAVNEIPDGGCLVSGEVLLARTGDQVVGHSSVCTHQGGRVAPQGADARCPLHGSVFSASTGAVVNGPATKPLPAVPVTVKSGSVFTA